MQAPEPCASGVTCVGGTTVTGPVTVTSGAALVVSDGTIDGSLRATSAGTVQLLRSVVSGPVRLTGTSDDVTVVGSDVRGPLVIDNSRTGREPVVAGTRVDGSLRCSGNDPAPVDPQPPNDVMGQATGQCRALSG